MNKKNKQKSSKYKLWQVLLVFAVFLFVAFSIYFFLTASDDGNHLTLLEKRWISENKDTLIDIKVPSNLAVLADNGDGVFFDFLNNVEENTELNFNKVAYTYPTKQENNLGILVLSDTDNVLKDDIYLMSDNYVLVGTQEGFIKSEKDIYSKRIGVLETDYNKISNYFNSAVTLNKYSNISSLIQALKQSAISYFIVPRYAYLNNITSDTALNIKYHFSDISNKIVLRLGNEKRLNSVLTKYANEFKNNELVSYINNNTMEYYLRASSTSDLDKSSLTSKVFRYGYVKDSENNISSSGDVYGIAADYVHTLEAMADMEFSYISFDSVDALKKAIQNKSVDFAFVDFDFDSTGYLKTTSPFNEKMVVLSTKYAAINSKDSLAGRNLYVRKDSALANYLSKNSKASLSYFEGNHFDIDDNSLLVVDYYTYQYYKNSKLKSYQVLFTDSYNTDASYVVNGNEKVFYNLLNFTLVNEDYNLHQEQTILDFANISKSQKDFESIYMLVLTIVFVPVLLIILVLLLSKRSKNTYLVKKEDVLKYNDLLTSLKNRNYLNDNIERWDEALIYPRTIIIADLNNLKYVNDNYGHEEGNELIQKAAAILINTQLEKSEIIRTDGNEFLIYLIGYSKTQVNTYISKLSREFEKLPHGFGAAIGYSMIEDEIKTIDDAINEATISMRMDKEQNYR